MDRRSLIIGAAGAAGALPLVGATGAGAAEPCIAAVVFDRRYPASRRFAEVMTRRGAVAFAAQDDVIRLWRGPLSELAARPGFRMAGLTTWSDFSLLKASAREGGRTLLGEGMHDGSSRNRLVHTLRYPGASADVEAACTAEPALWATALAQALAARASATGHFRKRVVSAPMASAEYPGALASWLIA